MRGLGGVVGLMLPLALAAVPTPKVYAYRPMTK